MRITVIGSGNSILIYAAKIYEKSHEVAILRTTSKCNVFLGDNQGKGLSQNLIIL